MNAVSVQSCVTDEEDQIYHQNFTLIEDGPSKKYACKNCGEIFYDIDVIQLHIQSKHIGQKTTNSTTSQKKRKPKNLIKVANFLEVGPDFNIRFEKIVKYICDNCSKEFPNRTSLQSHIAAIHRLRKCPKCDLEFNYRRLKIHMHNAHGDTMPTCGICGYKSPIQAKMLEHQRKVHMQEKNAVCDQCDLTFYDRHALRRHKISHGGERKYECALCHKKYPRLNTLRLHEKIHTKEKNKVCSVCGERFVQKASLNYHMLKHHPDAC